MLIPFLVEIFTRLRGTELLYHHTNAFGVASILVDPALFWIPPVQMLPHRICSINVTHIGLRFGVAEVG